MIIPLFCNPTGASSELVAETTGQHAAYGDRCNPADDQEVRRPAS